MTDTSPEAGVASSAPSAGEGKAPPVTFFGWVEPDGTVFLYDGLQEAPTRKRVGAGRAAQVSGRACIVVQRGPHRWLALSDWPLGDGAPGTVALFKRDPANTARARQ